MLTDPANRPVDSSNVKPDADLQVRGEMISRNASALLPAETLHLYPDLAITGTEASSIVGGCKVGSLVGELLALDPAYHGTTLSRPKGASPATGIDRLSVDDSRLAPWTLHNLEIDGTPRYTIHALHWGRSESCEVFWRPAGSLLEHHKRGGDFTSGKDEVVFVPSDKPYVMFCTIVGAALIVFLVLLFTDIAGFTKVYPFTRSIR